MAQLPARRSARYHSVVASLNEGVLTVTVPESGAAKPRHVEITG